MPSRTGAPFPPVTMNVKNVSMTSSLSARPPHVSCVALLARCALDLEEGALLDVGLG